jgi:hypothetical protein
MLVSLEAICLVKGILDFCFAMLPNILIYVMYVYMYVCICIHTCICNIYKSLGFVTSHEITLTDEEQLELLLTHEIFI